MLGRRGICLVTGAFGGRRNSVCGTVAILKVSAKGALTHSEIGRTDSFSYFPALKSCILNTVVTHADTADKGRGKFLLRKNCFKIGVAFAVCPPST